MIHKTYEFTSKLSAQEAGERIGWLFSEAHVEYKTAELSVTSTDTPLVFVSVDRRLYSWRNWTRINPFTFVTSVDVQFEPEQDEVTKVTVHINRFRAFGWVAFWVICCGLTALGLPEPAGAIFFIGVTCAAWFGNISFFAGYLVKKEITNSLMVI